MEIITSKSGFRYIYERESGYLSLLPESSTESGKTSTPDYHHKKLEYLRNHGLIKCDDNQSNYRFLEKGDIENTILNTHQIILEVTDICNLECYYCGYGKLYNNYDERIGG